MSGYDSWLEAPYQRACAEGEREAEFLEAAIDRISDRLGIDPEIVDDIISNRIPHSRAEQIWTELDALRGGRP